MKESIDNINLDETNAEFKYALDFVKHTNKLIYLTGKAGTGKTTFLKHLRQIINKNTVILAPTGVAAINAGGQTINSFFQLPFGPFVLNDKRLRTTKNLGDPDDTTIYSTFKYGENKKNIIEKLELLIIDEISMVRSDTLDVIDRILRVFRKKVNLPFGGVQVILIGDTFQLPPIAKFEEWEILKNHYESPFFFSSSVFKENNPVYIEFKKIYRQKEQEFIDLLNKIRTNQISDTELNELNRKYNPSFTSVNSDNHIILSTTNSEVNRTNATKLEELSTETKIFHGELSGTFPKDGKGDFVLPTEQNLKLKVGAQVMILRNDSGEYKKYFNGKIGKIDSLEENRIVIQFADESKVQIDKTTWEHIKYTWNKETQKIEETVVGSFTQYPLRLAWAITVHKSQGLTFENVYADLGSAFEDGQVYVALSRCTSLNGLVLKSKIERNKISTNKKVLEFAKTETPHTLIVEELTAGKADYYYQKVREDIKASSFSDAYANFTKAIKFRNDIETETFKKYFTATASRLASYKANYEKLHNDFEQITEECASYKSSVFNLEQENSELKTKIEEQNRSINILLDQKNDREATIKQLENKINELEIANIKYQSENLAQENRIRDLVNNSLKPSVDESIAINFLYENSQRGVNARKEWIDSLNYNWCDLLFGIFYRGYSDTELLQMLNNLTELKLEDQKISDLTPLKDLTKLTNLNLYKNEISDVTSLKNLTNLTNLNLFANQITDLSPLTNLSNLTELDLRSNEIIDITPLKNLTKLTELELSLNQISDLRPLKDLTNLTKLYLTGNHIIDVTPLKDLTNLTELFMTSNLINDITPLKDLTNLTSLRFDGNQTIDTWDGIL